MLEGSPVPQPGSFGQGWDLVMAILIGGFLYASLGTAYNVKAKQMPLVRRTMIAGICAAVSKHSSQRRLVGQGVEAFPQVEFWRQLSGLVADGVTWTRAKAGGDTGGSLGEARESLVVSEAAASDDDGGGGAE